MGVVRPADAMPENVFYRNGEADEMLYVHEGEGLLDTVFGPLRYGPGDYLVLPIGTTWRLAPDAGSEQRMLYLECPSEIEAPEALSKRLRPAVGALAVSRSATSDYPTMSRRGPTRASSGSTSRCATG